MQSMFDTAHCVFDFCKKQHQVRMLCSDMEGLCRRYDGVWTEKPEVKRLFDDAQTAQRQLQHAEIVYFGSVEDFIAASQILDDNLRAVTGAKTHALEVLRTLLWTSPSLTVYRVLRPDEHAAIQAGGGICTRSNGEAKLPGTHVQAGNRAKKKSLWVSVGISLSNAMQFARDSSGIIAAITIHPEKSESPPTVEIKVDKIRDSRSQAAVCVQRKLSAYSRDHPGAQIPTTFKMPQVIHTCGWLGAEEPTVPVVASITLPVTAGMGVMGRRFANKADEILIGGNEPGEEVIPRSQIVALGRVDKDTNTVAWTRTDQSGPWSPPSQGEQAAANVGFEVGQQRAYHLLRLQHARTA